MASTSLAADSRQTAALSGAMSHNPFMDWKPTPEGPEAPIGDTLVVHWKIDQAYASNGSTKKFEGIVIDNNQSWLHLRDKMGHSAKISVRRDCKPWTCTTSAHPKRVLAWQGRPLRSPVASLWDQRLRAPWTLRGGAAPATTAKGLRALSIPGGALPCDPPRSLRAHGDP